jgi:hypothetical protein
MATDTSMIQPADDAAPPSPQVQPANAPAPPAGPKLSEKLLKMPAMQALFAGAPPALSAPTKDFTQSKRDEAKIIKDNLPALQQVGMGFYKSLSGHLGVIYNMLHVHLQDLQAADKAGKLTVLAPDFDSITHAVSKSGARNPVLAVRGVPKGFKTPTPQAPPLAAPVPPGASGPAPAPMSPPPAPQVRPAPAGVQRKLANARVANLQPGAPTSGASPGAGRLLNAIMKPVI